MAEPKRQRAKLHRTISSSLIPETGNPFDVWLATDTNTVWLTARNGVVFCINDVLDGVVAHTPPRHGETGSRGERGERGETGAVGATGAAGTAGAKGERGDLTLIGDRELQAAVQQLRIEKARYLAAIELQLERNAGRQHRGLREAIANVLGTIKKDGGIA